MKLPEMQNICLNPNLSESPPPLSSYKIGVACSPERNHFFNLAKWNLIPVRTFSPKTRKDICKLSHKNLNFLSGLDCLSLNILQENDSLIFDASEKLVKKRS